VIESLYLHVKAETTLIHTYKYEFAKYISNT